MIQHCKCNHPYVPQERITLQLTMVVFHLENECLPLSSSDFQRGILGIGMLGGQLGSTALEGDEIG
jgi:hypothetical protein